MIVWCDGSNGGTNSIFNINCQAASIDSNFIIISCYGITNKQMIPRLGKMCSICGSGCNLYRVIALTTNDPNCFFVIKLNSLNIP